MSASASAYRVLMSDASRLYQNGCCRHRHGFRLHRDRPCPWCRRSRCCQRHNQTWSGTLWRPSSPKVSPSVSAYRCPCRGVGFVARAVVVRRAGFVCTRVNAVGVVAVTIVFSLSVTVVVDIEWIQFIGIGIGIGIVGIISPLAVSSPPFEARTCCRECQC